eukprot:11440-Hanusia_phi.AAC.1
MRICESVYAPSHRSQHNLAPARVASQSCLQVPSATSRHHFETCPSPVGKLTGNIASRFNSFAKLSENESPTFASAHRLSVMSSAVKPCA